MKILVTGAGGLLGSEFVGLGQEVESDGQASGDARGDHAADDGGAGATPVLPRARIVGLARADLDVTDAVATAEVIGDVRPDWVIHCAAYTAVDGAEDEPEEAMRVNHGGTVNVAAAAARCGARLLYVSTDYVFDGRKGEPYLPSDPVAPMSVYARTKRAGEEVALVAGGVAVRTGWLYGAGGGNFVDAILRRAERGEALRVVDDQRGRPTWARNVAETVVELIGGRGSEQRAQSSAGHSREGRSQEGHSQEGPLGLAGGIWHVADGGDATWLELAREAVRLRGIDVEITGVSTEAWGAVAPRPKYSILNLSETEERLRRPMMHWKDALAEYLTRRERAGLPGGTEESA